MGDLKRVRREWILPFEQRRPDVPAPEHRRQQQPDDDDRLPGDKNDHDVTSSAAVSGHGASAFLQPHDYPTLWLPQCVESL